MEPDNTKKQDTSYFDEEAFLKREDNMINIKLDVNQYYNLINGFFPIQNGVQLDIFNLIFNIGEAQKSAVLARYEAEVAEFNASKTAPTDSKQADAA